MRLPFLQSWLREPEPGFHPASASFSRRNGSLLVEVRMDQPCPPGSLATAHGQRLWELGDVVELFLQREGEESYREYQVSPNGFTLCLLYPDLSGVASVRAGTRDIGEFVTGEIPNPQITFAGGGWNVLLTVPLETSPDQLIRISCCRYDRSRGGPPVISSTSLHPVRDFHRTQEWLLI